MPLDSYVLETHRDIPKIGFNAQEHDLELQFWSDNWEAHKWFSKIYKENGGRGLCNGHPLRLDLEDILLLEYETLKKTPEKAVGYFDFCAMAKKSMEKGSKVYYYGNY